MRARRPKPTPSHPPAAALPLPHPSWSPRPANRRRIGAQEFWQRLGL